MSKPQRVQGLVYAATVFGGAALGFLVQPLLGKTILPWFGGVPAVWTACLLFFQTALLIGYAYAHLLSRSPVRRQARLHALLVTAALALLAAHAMGWPSPITPGAPPSSAGAPLPRVLLLLSAAVGLPYAVLAATSPLLMRWYAELRGEEPYRLYAISNAGSLLGLVAYPLAVEPWLPVASQGRLWASAFVLYALGLLACGALAARQLASRAASAPERPRRRDLAAWTVLAALGCAALLSITNQLCQEVAVVPFLWVLPLTVYLTSLILCFASPRWARPVPWAVGLLAQPVAAYVLLGDTLFRRFLGQVAVLSALLFAIAMLAHGELARRRPGPAQVTAYTLAIAAGGALGGVAVAILAPLAFPALWELHATLLLAQFLAAAVLVGAVSRRWLRNTVAVVEGLALAGLGVVLVRDAREHVASSIRLSRSFYGALRVLEHYPGDPLNHHYELRHGSTTHGYQLQTPGRRSIPTSYYAEGSGIARAFALLRQRRPDRGSRLGVVGLGVGTLLAYSRPGDAVSVYELDPGVARLSTERRPLFTFLADRRDRVRLVLGDARLSLERELAEGHPGGFHLLALDAFSSDSIPAHLLTEEAMRLYLAHLAPDGLLAVHVSNRHLDLTPVLWSVAGRLGLQAALVDVRKTLPWSESSIWMILARPPLLDGTPFEGLPGPGTDARRIRWTDTRSDLLRVLRRR